MVCALVASCNEPKFDFTLETEGVVTEASTVNAQFYVHAANVSEQYADEICNEGEALPLYAPEGVKAAEWLDRYVGKEIIGKLNDPLTYHIAVKGYVKEVNTGLKFEIDKVWEK